ncbi:hypothetical protein WICMUC_005578 [Wickerhamomyces mucosus]|uniref:t-SNARE coiled-coil homology domain-containing protein n=1 Tax=Wickerhamomyces mucosus TaxID=1378264 RepID=A0A9P8P7X0_9ASCO|nr:hypothetical protein WICMUC_005578 [Wickerhamomyces mucosus]
MSFRDLDVDLEAQKPFTDSPEFDNYSDQASNVLLDINNELITLEKFVNSLKSKKELLSTEQINLKSIKLIETITTNFKGLGSLVKGLNNIEELNPAQQFTKDRINKELKNNLKKFQSLQENFKIITDSITDRAKTALFDEQEVYQNNSQGFQDQELILEENIINNEEFVYQQNLIRERDEEIANIEQGVQELNEIFQDLGTIVQEQGGMVDNIESNIYNFSSSTKNAANELTKALNYQRRSKVQSSLQLTNLNFSSEASKSEHQTVPLCPFNSAAHNQSSSSSFHNLIESSYDDDANKSKLGCHTTCLTSCVCSCKTDIHSNSSLWSSASQIQIDLSLEHDANKSPFEDQSTHLTSFS